MNGAIGEVYSSLNGQFRGDLLRPGHTEFSEARRIWNGMVARTPGLIARCAGVQDVQAVVRAASAAGISPAIRCGGHSLAGFSSCEGGMVIDLTNMRQVNVEETDPRARFSGGAPLAPAPTLPPPNAAAPPPPRVSPTTARGPGLSSGSAVAMRPAATHPPAAPTSPP